MPSRFVTRRLALVLAGALLASGVAACARSVRAGSTTPACYLLCRAGPSSAPRG